MDEQNKIDEMDEIDEIDERESGRSKKVGKTVKAGISFGSALAMVIRYVNWHSVGWAIFHGLLSWVYVIYYIIRY